MRNTMKFSALLAVGAITLAGCASSDPLDTGEDGTDSGNTATITIGSADFAESQILANIYALALADQGIDVEQRASIGSREVYMLALQDGSIDLVPEYVGALLRYVDTESTETELDEVLAALEDKLPEGIISLDPSTAANSNALAVTAETAAEYGLASFSDVTPYAEEWAIGGPPEWEQRQNGIVGLRDVYGMEFREFVALDAGGPLSLSALENGQVEVANIFTTDPVLADGEVVSLEDDQKLFAVENVTPVGRESALTPEAISILNDVSTQLTTDQLIEMNQQSNDGVPFEQIARDWIDQNLS